MLSVSYKEILICKHNMTEKLRFMERNRRDRLGSKSVVAVRDELPVGKQECSYLSYLPGQTHRGLQKEGRALPSNIPLIGFWIHKMPPIRCGDWPSIPIHRTVTFPSPLQPGAPEPAVYSQSRELTRCTCHTTCCRMSSLNHTGSCGTG